MIDIKVMRGSRGEGGPPPPTEKFKFFKFTQNMPRTVLGKFNHPSDPPLENFLYPRMKVLLNVSVSSEFSISIDNSKILAAGKSAILVLVVIREHKFD